MTFLNSYLPFALQYSAQKYNENWFLDYRDSVGQFDVEMQNLSVSVLSLLARYTGRKEREELVRRTTQIERSIPHGDKLQWIQGSDELNLFLLLWIWE